ncbi:MAG: short-chain dehydrogenase, partial [Pseudomonas sp.]
MSHSDLGQSFSGQYFVVTGSTQGLGAAVAHTLA